MESIASPGMWAGFVGFVLVMLALDLGVFNRKAHEPSYKEAIGWSLVWITMAGLFAGGVWWLFGPDKAMEFTAGYLIEKALSIDNIFVFVLLFGTFAVPRIHQHRVLFWGVLGALVMRAIFIWLGAAVLARFHFVLYGFGALLLFTGAKMLFAREGEVHPERNPIFRLFRRLVPTTSTYHEGKFWVVEAGRKLATPLFTVLVLVEITDLIFAVDSIPAIFAVTQDPFIVFTSNIFAILGLRSLYFVLAGMVGKFHHLKPALALVLGFVGAKLVLLDVVKIPTSISLAVVGALIAGGIVASLVNPKQPVPEAPKQA